MGTAPGTAGPAPDVGRYGSMSVVPAVARGWGGRSDPQRLELYTRWSFYLTIGLPAPGAPRDRRVGAGRPALRDTVLLGALRSPSSALLIVRAGMGGPRGVAPAATAAARRRRHRDLGTAVAAFSSSRPKRRATPCRGASRFRWAILLIACPPSGRPGPRHRWRGRRVVVAVGLLVAGVQPVEALVLGALLGVVLTGIAQSFRFSVWVLDVVREMERTRGVQLQLAVAEERLRFARDLHDVMGRNLSAIAVKSQLAGELVRRADRRRPTRWPTSAASPRSRCARSARSSAGTAAPTSPASSPGPARCCAPPASPAPCSGEDAGAALPAAAQTALGWVVREAVTNVLRHSRATSCTIDLRVRAGKAELRVVNDGVPTPGARGPRLGQRADRARASGWPRPAGGCRATRQRRTGSCSPRRLPTEQR